MVYVSADALVALRTCLPYGPAAVPGEATWNWARPHRALSSKGMQKKMERYAKAAGIKASCHSLRHTFASNLLEEGAEVISIKELLHASMESSERYAKLSNQRVKQILSTDDPQSDCQNACVSTGRGGIWSRTGASTHGAKRTG